MVRVAWFVVNIPQVHSLVVLEVSDHVQEVLSEDSELGLVRVSRLSRCLHPLRVVHTRNWRRLYSKFGIRIPAIIEHREHCLDSVFVRYCQELIYSILEAFLVLFPHQIMQEHSDDFVADAFCVSEFLVNGNWVESLSLPHFQLVHSTAGDEVAASEPAVGVPPGLRLLRSPLGTTFLEENVGMYSYQEQW